MIMRIIPITTDYEKGEVYKAMPEKHKKMAHVQEKHVESKPKSKRGRKKKTDEKEKA